MLASYIQVPIQVLASLFPTQVPASALGKATKDGPITSSHATLKGDLERVHLGPLVTIISIYIISIIILISIIIRVCSMLKQDLLLPLFYHCHTSAHIVWYMAVVAAVLWLSLTFLMQPFEANSAPQLTVTCYLNMFFCNRHQPPQYFHLNLCHWTWIIISTWSTRLETLIACVNNNSEGSATQL